VGVNGIFGERREKRMVVARDGGDHDDHPFLETNTVVLGLVSQ